MTLVAKQKRTLGFLLDKNARGRANPGQIVDIPRIEEVNETGHELPIETFKVSHRVRRGYILDNGHKRQGFLPEHEMEYLTPLGLDYKNMIGSLIELAVAKDLGRMWKLTRLPIALGTAGEAVGRTMDGMVWMIRPQAIYFKLGLAFLGTIRTKNALKNYKLGDKLSVKIVKFSRSARLYRLRDESCPSVQRPTEHRVRAQIRYPSKNKVSAISEADQQAAQRRLRALVGIANTDFDIPWPED